MIAILNEDGCMAPEWVTVTGVIGDKRVLETALTQAKMCTFTLADGEKRTEVIVFPDVYVAHEGNIQDGLTIQVRGEIPHPLDDPKVVAR